MAALSLLACSTIPTTAPYTAYRKANPSWNPGKPEVGMPADEALANAFNPRGPKVTLANSIHAIYDWSGEEWVEAEPTTLLYTPEEGDRVVITKRNCKSRSAGIELLTIAYYYFRDAALLGLSHWEFKSGCAGRHYRGVPIYGYDFKSLVPEDP